MIDQLINILFSYHLKNKQQRKEIIKRHQQNASKMHQLRNQSDVQSYNDLTTFLLNKQQGQQSQQKREIRESQSPYKMWIHKYRR
jgi:hypothetical protein